MRRMNKIRKTYPMCWSFDLAFNYSISATTKGSAQKTHVNAMSSQRCEKYIPVTLPQGKLLQRGKNSRRSKPELPLLPRFSTPLTESITGIYNSSLIKV